MSKFKMEGTCVLKEAIKKGDIHYSPQTEAEVGEEFKYVRKYSKFQKDNNETSEEDVPDRVFLYKGEKKFLQTNDYAFDCIFEVDEGVVWKDGERV